MQEQFLFALPQFVFYVKTSFLNTRVLYDFVEGQYDTRNIGWSFQIRLYLFTIEL